MTNQKTDETRTKNKYNLKVGDIIEFINSVNYPVKITITRVEEKSCYDISRNSWGTINGFIEKYNAKITRV